ncbi:ABC transporter permease subunit [Caldicoprobacter algeriensis]|uniref:ABC transporter permease n=1 Tax=Caldicoprobacter algeriensis TaxID=699281 RepID=UPI00207AD6F7|nr:ABC transporter permease subunit [Caldicoprobacter algeriensis]MCM8900527.1 ABC transporter permease subunit [Caldicoprobacter algeriensis]
MLARLYTEWNRNKYVYIILLPVVAYYIIFHYLPMYGVIIAWKRFTPMGGIWGSEWVGWRNFENFFKSYYFFRLLRNTFLINLYGLIFSFPAPIILALLLNEIKVGWFKRTVQTISYLPHFISTVVICGMLVNFLAPDGLINTVLAVLGVEPKAWLRVPGAFRIIYVSSGIWQEVGWGSIIYLAALSNIDPQLYEAATIDGANRWQKMWHITIPGIIPTIVIMFILRMGSMLSVGAEKIILLYNPTTYEVADVISTFVYRRGLMENDYSFSAAVGLFNSVVNFMFLIIANTISRRVSESSLW